MVVTLLVCSDWCYNLVSVALQTCEGLELEQCITEFPEKFTLILENFLLVSLLNASLFTYGLKRTLLCSCGTICQKVKNKFFKKGENALNNEANEVQYTQISSEDINASTQISEVVEERGE